MSPFLSEIEVCEMCSPLVQAAAQRKYLKKIGVDYKIKPSGFPLVPRDGVFQSSIGIILTKPTEPSAADFKAMMLAKRSK